MSTKTPGLSDTNRYSQSLQNGLALLRCFSDARPVMALAEITAAVGMSQSSTHRYATTLVALGYLEQDGARKYRLGRRVRDLGSAALVGTGWREHSQPLLQELCGRTGCTTALGMLDGEEAVCVDLAVGLRGGRARSEQCLRPGSRLPAYCTAMGKVLLAHLPEEELEGRIAQMTLGERGPNTITSPGALQRELSRVRESGVAFNDQELCRGVYGIAAPVRDRTGAVRAAVGVVANASSMRGMQAFVVAVQPRVVSVAGQLSVLFVDGFRKRGG